MSLRNSTRSRRKGWSPSRSEHKKNQHDDEQQREIAGHRDGAQLIPELDQRPATRVDSAPYAEGGDLSAASLTGMTSAAAVGGEAIAFAA